MDQTIDSAAGLSTIADITEKTARFLDAIGIEFSVLALQLIALCALLAVAAPLVLAAWKREGAGRYVALAGALPLALLLLLILLNWLGLLLHPVPDYAHGRVTASDLHGIRVELLDFRGRELPAGPPEVDSASGRFGLNFEAAFGDYPRRFRLQKPGCRPQEHPLGLARLRAGQAFELPFSCEAGS